MKDENENDQNQKSFEVNEKNIAFVQEQHSKGRSEDAIINDLISQGMTEVDATDLVYEISFASDPEVNISPNNGITLMILGAILIIIGLIFLMLMLSTGRISIFRIGWLIILGIGILMKGHSAYSNR